MFFYIVDDDDNLIYKTQVKIDAERVLCRMLNYGVDAYIVNYEVNETKKHELYMEN